MSPTPPSASSVRPLLWLALGLLVFVVAVFLLLGDSWSHWFPKK